MTVKELQEILAKYDDNLEVKILANDSEIKSIYKVSELRKTIVNPPIETAKEDYAKLRAGIKPKPEGLLIT